MAVPVGLGSGVDDEDAEPDLYKVLELKDASKATKEDIKRAYRRLALLHHPDKLASRGLDEDALKSATVRFQTIGVAYTILSDDTKRARYDATGSLEDSSFDDRDGNFDWTEYFKSLWTGEVSVESIEEFEKKYKGELLKVGPMDADSRF